MLASRASENSSLIETEAVQYLGRDARRRPDDVRLHAERSQRAEVVAGASLRYYLASNRATVMPSRTAPDREVFET